MASPPVRHGKVATHRAENAKAVLGPPAGPPPAGEQFPLPRTMDPNASLIVNAWPPEWAFWLGLGGPRIYATLEVPMANPFSGVVQPGTRLPPVNSLFTPIPAIPATGPGMDYLAYQMGYAFGSGATVTWRGMTNRGQPQAPQNAQPGTRFPWLTNRNLR